MLGFRLRRRWLVNYTFMGGTGRVFMTTRPRFFSERLVEDMDAWLRSDDPERGGTVTQARPMGVPFGLFIEKESSDD